MKVYTKTPFDYDRLKLEGGEVFELMGKRNDEKLLEHRFVVEVKETREIRTCSCGKEFMGDMFYHKHLSSSNHPKEVIVLKDVEFVSASVKRKKAKAKKKVKV